jgi:Cytochrome P460
MRKSVLVAISSVFLLAMTVAWSVHSASVAAAPLIAGNTPAYTTDGQLRLPANYRDWIFLSSGFGMNYSNGGGNHPMFTNVFVSPEAYQGFKSSGRWPDRSMFVVEIYSPATQGSINKSGYYQQDFKGLDIEVKDSARKQEWSYYNFNPGEKTASALGGGCEKCHNEHGAVEHTFVQFYPTLLEFAREKKLLKAGVPIQ